MGGVEGKAALDLSSLPGLGGGLLGRLMVGHKTMLGRGPVFMVWIEVRMSDDCSHRQSRLSRPIAFEWTI